MMRTACIRLNVTTEQAARLSALRTAYADACNRLVPLVQAARCWNRVALHQLGYRALRQQTSLGAQMACNGKILTSGLPKEAELVFRAGQWFFNLAVESADGERVASGPVMGVDVGENTLAATSTGRVWGGETLRHRRDQHLALRRRLQSNGSQSATQRLRQVSGKERRRVRHVNHETSKAILEEARRIGAATIAMEDLTHIRDRLRARRRMRARLHRWAFRQLQGFVEYKARAIGISVVYVNPAYTSQTCSACGQLGARLKHRFECSCGLRAHADLNASRNLARIGETAVSPRAVVNTPDVDCVACHASP
ncbi:MAG: IS200/IS605 family element transposase accessory protein TnpB [Gammaproteobacteria bacterium]|nr:MAG: IS200/IS605 family element transposase accessory protein TnpB [Gammaproteobacteria bacterium]